MAEKDIQIHYNSHLVKCRPVEGVETDAVIVVNLNYGDKWITCSDFRRHADDNGEYIYTCTHLQHIPDRKDQRTPGQCRLRDSAIAY